MGKRSAKWFGGVAIAALITGLAMVPAMHYLQEAHLSLWLHIPLTFVVLNAMAGGAAVAGFALLEYRARSAGGGQQA